MTSRSPILRLAAVALLVASVFRATPASAGIFNPHLILSDEDLRDASAMSFDEIRLFLAEKGGLAQAFDVDPADGLLKSAPQLIHDAATRYRVNPKYLLALIQKESSAVETARPTKPQLDWATGYSLCDGCYKDRGLALRYKGLAKQIDAGAGWVDWYMANATAAPYLKQPRTTYVISGTNVTPLNLATAALYSYTPHLHGNRLLWSIMNRWFGNGIGGLEFPDGTLVRNEKTGAVALIQNGKFRPVLSRSVLTSRFNERTVVDLNTYDFDALERTIRGTPVRFPDLSLVRAEDGTTYLLVGAVKRRIASPEAFARVGFNPEEVEDASDADLKEYPDGEPVTMASASPGEKLVQDRSTGGVYAIEDGKKRPLWDRALLTAAYPGRRITPMSSKDLAGIPNGDPVRFPDGALLRSAKGDIFVISEGKKRRIVSEAVFVGLGYRWENVLSAGDRALGLMGSGEPISFSAE